MSKVSIGKVFDAARILKTKSGQEIEPLISYFSQFADVVIRALGRGISVRDNMDCIVKQVSLANGDDQVVSTAKKPIGIVPIRVVDTSAAIDAFGWNFNTEGQVVCRAEFSPVGDYDVVLLILF